ncbi:glycosyltransferase [Vibrio splendidus]
MVNNNVAVAMSVYKSDNSEHLEMAILSVLNQSHSKFDLFIEVDGSIPSSTRGVLSKFDTLANVFVNYNSLNEGLATRLNQIINTVVEKDNYGFVARMDADDVSSASRFEKQVDFLIENPEISVVGSDVIEISCSGDELFYKRMSKSHDEMFDNIIKKCPFNHPSVMFNISVFNSGIRYNEELMNTQDYYLWVDLLALNKQFANINEPLLKFRVNESFHSRRGLKKAINDLNSRLYAFKKLKVYSMSNILHVFLLFLLRLSPGFIKSYAYNKFR